MNKLAKTFLIFGAAGLILSSAMGTAMAEDSTQSEVTQAATYDQGNGGYYAEAVGDHAIKITLSNASFRPERKELQVVNSHGEVVETLGSRMQASNGQKLGAHYEVVSDSQALIHFENPRIALPGGWGDYAKCISKSAAGNALSGCVVGAIGGGWMPSWCWDWAISGGVTGLVTCW
ncbi:hypothetical protein GP475_10350 [Corynebacterium poyangense]|uniref:Uncharacterized protein n=1 Tax=Corynebacterium poyangense TaxID=2684405 RepID=A0A7H0SR12_9CORY|nr:hypothetical protein [Corynebacterium poyangense]MBZ8176407.1 hypothetical protein [Corynebacterium poyangense]QNQ90987.1 hypothetical protein GP475_10350 [Corynebacterium poyangense]